MGDVQVLIFKLASIVLLAIVGYFISSRNILKDNGKDVVSLLLNRVAMPFMIITAYIKIRLTPETIQNAFYVIIVAVIIYIANYFYSAYTAKKFKLTPEQKSVYINGGVHANTAFLAFPLLYSVYGDTGLFYATMYYMVDNILLTTTGMKRLMSSYEGKRSIAPVTLALLISLPIMAVSNVFNLDLTNTILYQTANDLGTLTTPLAFIFIGMIVYETNVRKLLLNKHAISLIIVKMTVIPLLFILAFKLMNFDIEGVVIIVIMTQALMPPFSALLSMSYEYKQDVELATSLVVLGHIYSIISIPLVFALLVYLFG